MATSKRRCAFEKEKLPSNPCIASAGMRPDVELLDRSIAAAGMLKGLGEVPWIEPMEGNGSQGVHPTTPPHSRRQASLSGETKVQLSRAQKIFGAESVRAGGGGMEEEGEEYLGARALAPLLRSGNAVLCWHERSLACPHCPPQSAPASRAICATPSACLSAAARASRSDSWTTTSKASCAARTC